MVVPSVAFLLAGLSLVQAFPFSDADALYGLQTRASSLVNCLYSKNVPISLSSSSNFAQLAEPYNLRLPYTPAAIALPTTPQHVSDAVLCASQAGTKVQAKSGGHSYASYSSGGQDGSLMIDLQSFQNISVDQSTGIAQVGGGVRLGNLALALHSQGGRALPHGTCPGVGIGGHFTHGGFGFASRLWGLALDTIVGLDVVLANGSYIYASSTSYPDLFYALRGAADSFGIVTTFHLQTQPAPATVVDFAINIPSALNSAQAATNSFLHLQAFAQNSSVVDRQITFGLYIDAYQFRVYGLYYAGIDKFNNEVRSIAACAVGKFANVLKVLPEMLRGLPSASDKNIRTLAWLDALVDLGNGQLNTTLTGYDEHDTFYVRSVVTQEAEPLTQQAVQSFFNYALSNGRSGQFGWYSIIDLYGGADSQVNAHSPDESAYSHRSSLWVLQNYGRTSNSQLPVNPAMIPYIQGLSGALTDSESNGDFASYLNYVDPTYSASQAHQLYYGAGTYDKLAALKQTYDPNKVYWNPQAIGA